ncbi:hypothetical protein AQ490_24330 [Wenjunlia vitaminophila]|uniref:7-cyano-7-deazaguanine synthase n=1 Tax=Wenjunlia vitaminophila TaxID=76728 RepID=A0A0T6LRA9_WENVI|nr:7-cyano-7-deazaguanine synthase [Wenjunlia vitaminophila]KRV48663.1 hypothetical protein AQ490_24330 [Wenjunlia vitaminophila]
MTERTAAVWWKSGEKDLPPAPDSWTVVGTDSFQEKEDRITGRYTFPDSVPDWAEDLFRVARAIFVADKRVRRQPGLDRWTRHIHLSVPVAEPGLWHTPEVAGHLTTLLNTLTSDRWDLSFRRHPARDSPPSAMFPVKGREVILLSGGLDSLAWAATRARADTAGTLLLVRFREVSMLRLQDRVCRSVQDLSSRREVLRLRWSQTPTGDGSGQRLEPSSRSRGLLYVAGAIRAAAALDAPEVHIPENGQLSVNPPLTAARRGACSTRSVHPWTLHHLNALLRTLCPDVTPIQVVNPLAGMTKGEVCGTALDAGLSPSDLEATVSCGKPPRRRKGGPRLDNCGVCFPCLVRRSALLRATGSDNTRYELAPWSVDPSDPRAADWRALQRWLLRPFTVADLLADAPLPPDADPRALWEVINRGREELAALLPDRRAAA